MKERYEPNDIVEGQINDTFDVPESLKHPLLNLPIVLFEAGQRIKEIFNYPKNLRDDREHRFRAGLAYGEAIKRENQIKQEQKRKRR